jgi:hypothetical protein
LIDKVFYYNAFGDEEYPNGEIWFASSSVSGYKFGYLLVADLKKSYQLLYGDIELGMQKNHIAYNKMDESISIFSWKSPLPLSACGLDDFVVYTLSPIFNNGWSIIGEVDKWVGISSSRFVVIDTREGVVVHVSGSSGEVIRIGFVDPEMNLILVTCTFKSKIMSVGSDSSCRQLDP